ncbi:MAG: AAA family ATPase [Candidatus Aminicenantes bacterium]|jgi:hypothetical protein
MSGRKDFKDFLKELAEEPELKKNVVAKVVIRDWNTKELKTYPNAICDSIIPLVRDELFLKNGSNHPNSTQSSKESEESPGVEKYKGEPSQPDTSKRLEEIKDSPKSEEEDYRIKGLLLSAVRGIEHSKIPFGINLMDNLGEPRNAIIIGRNGSGKTSIFSSLEYIFTGEVSEAKHRKYVDDRRPDFFSYLKNIRTERVPYAEILTKSGELSFENDKLLANNNYFQKFATPKASFISEFDIQDWERADLSGKNEELFFNIAELLGFREYVEFWEYLVLLEKMIPKRMKEVNNFVSNHDRFCELWNEIDELKKKIEKSEDKQQQLDKESRSLKRRKKLLDIIIELHENTIFSSDIQKIKEIINSYIKQYKEYDSIQISNKDEELRHFLEQGLEFLKKEKECPFCKNSKLRTKDIKKNVEARLTDVKDVLEKDSTLSKIFKNTLEVLDSFLNSLYNSEDIIKKLIEKFKTIPQMNDYSNNVKKLKHNINFDFFRKQIELLQKESPLADPARKKLYDLLIDKKNGYLKNTLSSCIDGFKTLGESLNKTIENLSEQINKSSVLKALGEVEFEISSLKKNLAKAEKELKELKEQLLESREKLIALLVIINEVVPFQKFVEEKVKQLLENAITPLKEAVEKALESFFKEDKFKIKIDFKEIKEKEKSDINKKRLVIELVDENKNLCTTPKKYFNTSRYKIFCGAIAIGIALASRKHSGINLPLILDDVFFASDIANRAEFEKYFSSIVYMYRKFTPGLPLQIILFTHDELIFESAKEALANAWDEDNELNKKENEETKTEDYWESIYEKTKFARLFPSSERDKSYQETVDGEKYWNLLYEFKYPKK